MKIDNLNIFYQTQLDTLRAMAADPACVWQKEAQSLLNKAAFDFPDTDDLLETLHQIQRLNKIYDAGLATSATFKQDVTKENYPSWKNFGMPPASLPLQHSLAQKLYNADPAKNDFGLINIGDGAREIGKWLVEKCLDEKVPFIVNFSDGGFDSYILHHADDNGIKGLAAGYLRKTAPVTTIMTARPGQPERDYIKPDPKKEQLYSREVRGFSERVSSGKVFYTLTVIPTRKDAQIDNIPYDDYIKLFFEMCDQPWHLIGKAHEELIQEFNTASQVRITNDDGTDLTIGLVEDDGSHYTFCNSLIAKNVPGSEIFSGVRRDAVNGKVVAKGRFSEHGSDIIENLTMEFEKGKLVRYSADKGLDAFEKAIGVDEGARYVGELGIGTNPHLKTHVVNGLLVEKIGGSFHIALGRCYTYTEYQGVPVKVDNGNQSALHWDITTMLHGKGGRIYLDGRLVMDDGKWLDPKYDVLNRGWQAVPEDQRPTYWRNYYKSKPNP